MRDHGRLTPAWLLAACLAGPAAGATALDAGRPLAFVDVDVIPMDREGLLRRQTVVVARGVITAVGPAGAVSVPAGAQVIEGAGRVLLPGLTDAHVHIDRHVGARADFGDAPLFLAAGITTVFNLRGDPEHLEWRRRVLQGELLAPNLYTSGEFVNEPRVTSAAQAEHEVAAQARAGVDLIKFHEVTADGGRGATTHGLQRAAYLGLVEAARRRGVPLLGHAPLPLGLQGLLEARQSLAHTHELANLYFLPPLGLNRGAWMNLARASWSSLLVLVLLWHAADAPWRRRGRPAPPERARGRALATWSAALSLPLVGVWLLTVAGGLAAGSLALLAVLSALALAFGTCAARLVLLATHAWRHAGARAGERVRLALVASAACGAAVAAAYWVPFAWRSSDLVMNHVARECARRGIWVQSTLVLYESALARRDGYLVPQQLADPAVRALAPEVQARWGRITRIVPAWMAVVWQRHPAFNRRLLGALHRAGVPIMAGTDALGVPLVAPGTSLHRELQLLHESGLSPHEVLWTATVGPARFLGREREFGTLTAGSRADLLLVDGNPLEDLGRLRDPAGVMVRGRWLARETLRAMLPSGG